MSKIITVFGATGNQGGSVLRSLVGDKQYKVRAVTRNPDGEKAKAFKEQGMYYLFTHIMYLVILQSCDVLSMLYTNSQK